MKNIDETQKDRQRRIFYEDLRNKAIAVVVSVALGYLISPLYPHYKEEGSRDVAQNQQSSTIK